MPGGSWTELKKALSGSGSEMVKKKKVPKKLGVVVSGGGLNATCSAAGTFCALDELGVTPVALCGSSGGAITAGMYASGMPGDTIRSALVTLQLSNYFDPDYLNIIKGILNRFRGWHGLLKGVAVKEWLEDHMPCNQFEQCQKRCYIVTVNVSRGMKEVASTGNLITAIRASSAIPFIYKAVKMGNDYYIDGGAISNVPAYALSEAEPDLDHILVSSTQDITPISTTSEDIMSKYFTPYYIIKNWVESLVREERAVHLDTQHIPNTLMRVKMKKVEYFHPEDVAEGIETARQYVKGFLEEEWGLKK